ncbi:MAG TPA: ATP-binding protein [Longimicrobiaceae bacterium]|nr:ATP-binding protein [Longimicrobiaceae bacterium]
MARARDLPEAFSIFFDSILTPARIDRALVLVEEGAALHGVVGMGWDEAAARRVVVPLQDGIDPLAHAYSVGEPAVVEVGIEGGEPGRFRFLPIPCGPEEHSRCGALLVGPGPGSLVDLACVAESLREAGPLLGQLVELDRLRRSSRQVEQQRDLLTTIVNSLPDPVVITDVENNVLLENRRAESLFSTREGDTGGRRRAVEINNLLFSSFLTRSTIGGPEPNSRELNLVDPSEGGDLLFEVLTTALPPSLAGETSMISVLRDVTDLKRATAELEHQFTRLRHAEQNSRREFDRLNVILENVGDPILVTDAQANIILMNREAERLFELPAGTDLTSRTRQEVRANDTKFSSFISDFALGADIKRVAEITLSDPRAGREFPAEVVSGKLLNERGEMSAIVSVLHDQTKVVENERLASELSGLNENLEGRILAATEELEERNRVLEWQSHELERAYRLKSQFLASMSHELRTPINALLGYTSLMRDRIYGELNQRQDEALTRMYTASQHLLELVNDILDLAKIEAGKMPVHVEPVNVAEIVRELSLAIEPMVRQRHLEYRLDLGDHLPVIETDRTKVKQIVLNLLSNAVKFTHEGYIAVHARADEDGEGVEVEVEDSGIGIKEEDLAKIFEDFRQVDQSSTREYGGTGLGLSITKKLLHLLGGTIRVRSTPGEGSVFTIWLPRRSEEIVLDEEIARVARAADEAVVEEE